MHSNGGAELRRPFQEPPAPNPVAQGLKWLDAYRSVPKDMTEASGLGGLMTLLALVVCAALFFCEFSAFMQKELVTSLFLDSNKDTELDLFYDLLFWDIPCEHLEVGVYDAFGADRLVSEGSVIKRKIKASERGGPAVDAHVYSDQEIAALEAKEFDVQGEEKEQLDSEWTSTSDVFEHSSFKEVIEGHDLSIINFYADWCGHCRQLAPTWIKFKEETEKDKSKLVAKDGKTQLNVGILRINCVAFNQVCAEQGIQYFPTIRTYTRNGGVDEFNGHITEPAQLTAYLLKMTRKQDMMTNVKHHFVFREGCQVEGTMSLPRVPGVLHFELASSARRDYNGAATNVSHTVQRFGFGQKDQKALASVPWDMRKAIEPLNGRAFFVEKFHEAPKHFLKVMPTHYRAASVPTFYTISHQARTASFPRSATPQAQFHFDIAPVEIRVEYQSRKWYDFVTATLAIVGGTYTVIGVLTGMGNTASLHFKRNIGKLG